ncbi:MAG: transposase, partial [Alcanivorax sp.]|nr:transposase [Alcanivorax sp.]
MAMPASRPEIGIDAAKDNLVIHHQGLNQTLTIDNTPQAIRQWLATLPEGCDIAIEATSTYHMDLTERAHAKGHRVYVVDGYRLSHYRKGVGGRAKTDLADAQLLARHLHKEKDE